MTPVSIAETYRSFIGRVGEPVIIRRFTGGGTNPPRFDVEVHARVSDYHAEELVGQIQQGDRKVILLAQDLIDREFALPLTASDKLVLRGRQISIIAVDDSTRRVDGTLIAYELQCRG